MPKAKRLEPISPGEILAEEFMKPNGISQNRLSRNIDVNPAASTTLCTAVGRSPPRSRFGWASILAPRPSCG